MSIGKEAIAPTQHTHERETLLRSGKILVAHAFQNRATFLPNLS